MIFIVAIAVIAVVIYGIAGKKGGNMAAPKSTLPITEENLINFWERKDGEKICRLGFEYGNEFFYSEFPSESTVTPELTTANAMYKITADGLIIMTYEIDLESHTDTYNISLTQDSLTLTAVKGGGPSLRENTRRKIAVRPVRTVRMFRRQQKTLSPQQAPRNPPTETFPTQRE